MENEDKTAITETQETPPATTLPQAPVPLVPDERLLTIYQDVLTSVKNDREEISDILAKFLDMVVNDGDASSASKEAVVNLVKAKSETNEQVIKIAQLMTNLKLKERTIVDPAVNRAIHAQQNNIYNIGKPEETSILLEEIEKASSRIRRKR